MELTADNVEQLVHDTMFHSHEMPAEEILSIPAVVHTFVFSPAKIEFHADEIHDLLTQLPEQFAEGGWTFLNACLRKDGEQWTSLHWTVEQLCALGIAAGWGVFPIEREMWQLLPGSMPYFQVLPHRHPREAITDPDVVAEYNRMAMAEIDEHNKTHHSNGGHSHADD